MPGLFQGFEIEKRSLLSQQLAMFTSSYSVSDVNTPGPSRQCVNMSPALPLRPSNGRGVQVTSVRQLRDGFLDGQFRRENSRLGAWQMQRRVLGQVEMILGGPNDNTLGEHLRRSWQSWQQLAADPTSTVRHAVRGQGNRLVDAFHDASRQLYGLEDTLNSEIVKHTTALNEIGTHVAALNRQIASGELGADMTDDLRDKRNHLIDELSRLASVQVEETSGGATNIDIGNMEFVNAHQVQLLAAIDGSGSDGRRTSIVREGSGAPVQFLGGEMGAMFLARDVWLSESREALDTLAATLVNQVNARHCQGVLPDGRTGIPFYNPWSMDACSIQLHPAIADTSQQSIAAGRTAAESDVDIAQAIAELAEQAVMPDGRTSLNGFYESVIGAIGIRSAEAQEVSDTQALLVGQLANQRRSVEGASLDEELANMIEYQRAHEAAARVILTMDEAIGTVINGMGIVVR